MRSLKSLLTALLFFFTAVSLFAQERKTGKYRFEVNGTLMCTRSVRQKCTQTKLTMYQYSPGGGETTAQFFYADNFDTNGQLNVSYSTDFTYDRRVSRIYAWASLADSRNSGACKTGVIYAGYTWLPDWFYDNCTQFTATSIYYNDGAMRGTLFMKATPLMDEMLVQPDENQLPVDEPITINGPIGFTPAVYTWKYSLDQESWYYAAVGQGQDVFQTSAKQLMGSNWNNDYIGKPIFLQLVSPCNDASNFINYSIRLSSPHIISTTSTNPLCANHNTGNIRVKFDRALIPGEILNILLEDTVNHVSYPGLPGAVLDGNNEAVLENLAPGGYRITLVGKYKTDKITTFSTGVTHRGKATITSPQPVTFSSTGKKDVYCFGGSDGNIQVNATGGSGGFKVYWKLQNATGWNSSAFIDPANYTISGLPAGDYVFVVKDRYDCTEELIGGSGKEVKVTIGQPAAALGVESSTPTDPKAFGYNDGQIDVYLKGGAQLPSGGYNVTMKNAAGTNIPFNGSVAGTSYHIQATQLVAGTYTITATDAKYALAVGANGDGCILTTDIMLTEPPLLVATAVVKDSISCYELNDGSLQLTATGGKPFTVGAPYKYEWFSITGGIYTSIGQTTTTATDLVAGDYVVRITDANNITRESPVVHLVQPDKLKIAMTARNVSCYGGADGQLKSLVSGGTLSYRYQWNTGATTSAITTLSAGDYTLKVTDYHGCIANAYPEVTEPAAALAIATQTTTYPAAYGYTDGSIRVLLSGGTPETDGSYHITWTNENGNVLSTAVNKKISGGYETYLPNLGAGKYKLVVTDALYYPGGINTDIQSCRLEQDFTLLEPPVLEAAITEQHYVSCYGFTDGSLLATAKGGVPFSGAEPYKFQWYKIVNGTATSISQQAATALSLGAGKYLVMVTDFNNIDRFSDTFDLTQPPAMTLQLSTRAVTCFDGNDGFVKTTVTGGTLPYTYQWNNAADDADVLDVRTGEYQVTVTDNYGCFVTDKATVTQPAAPVAVVTTSQKDPLAFGYTDGHVTVTVNGGTPAPDGSYTMSWTNDQQQQLSSTMIKTADGYQTTLSGIGKGAYTLVVSDAQLANNTNGSTEGCTLTVQYSLDEPPMLTAAIEETHYISCFGDKDGVLEAHAVGGIPATDDLPYRYQWFAVVDGTETLLSSTDSILHNVGTGDYLVKVTDENNITRSSPVYHLATPAVLGVDIQTTPVTCASGADGTATAIVTGGTAPFEYQWTTGDVTQHIEAVTAGNLLVFIKDAHGCETKNHTAMIVPGGIETAPVTKDPTCNNNHDGSIKVNASGGTPPFIYRWDDGSTDADRYGLAAGSYTITISDAGNCKRVQHFTLKNPPALTVNLGADKTLCNAQTLTLDASIADARAKYAWTGSNGFTATTPVVTLKNSGQYKVQVTDGNGCTGVGSITINKSDKDIAASFVVSTQVFTNEDIYLFNISDPVPEAVQWIIPEGQHITLVDQTKTYAQLRFADTGVFKIGLRTMIGECDKVVTKNVNVLTQQTFPQPGGAQTPFIKTFEVSPNPNTGQFAVRITLDKSSAIRLRMINIISNQLVSDRKEAAATTFNLSYSVNMTAGVYLLVLETPLGNMIRKVVINQ